MLLASMLPKESVLDQSAFRVESVNDWVGIPVGSYRENSDFIMLIDCLQALFHEWPDEKAANLALVCLWIGDVYPV